MSFHIQFAARSASEARSKLETFHAPAAVKALIEKALDAIPVPQVAPPPQPMGTLPGGAGAGQAVGAVSARGAVIGAAAKQSKPEAFGVTVDCVGHIADAGGLGVSEIQRFVVRPLLA